METRKLKSMKKRAQVELVTVEAELLEFETRCADENEMDGDFYLREDTEDDNEHPRKLQ